jgi:hypothetical protein
VTLMTEYGFHHLPVVENERPIGMLACARRHVGHRCGRRSGSGSDRHRDLSRCASAVACSCESSRRRRARAPSAARLRACRLGNVEAGENPNRRGVAASRDDDVRDSVACHRLGRVSQVVVRSDGDRRLARRVSGRETIELTARISEDDVAIRHDSAGSGFLRPRDDDGVDAVLGEKPSNRPEARLRSACDYSRMHNTADGLVRLFRPRTHRADRRASGFDRAREGATCARSGAGVAAMMPRDR